MSRIVTTFNDDWEMVHDLKRAHQRSYIEYVSELLRERIDIDEENETFQSGLSIADRYNSFKCHKGRVKTTSTNEGEGLLK